MWNAKNRRRIVLPKNNTQHIHNQHLNTYETRTQTHTHYVFIQNQNVHKNLSAAFLSFLWTLYTESSFTHHKCLVNCDCNDARTTWKQLQSTADDREIAINMHLFACAPLYHTIRIVKRMSASAVLCSFRFCSSFISVNFSYPSSRYDCAVIFDLSIFFSIFFFAIRVHTVKCWQWRQHRDTRKKQQQQQHRSTKMLCAILEYTVGTPKSIAYIRQQAYFFL